MFIGLRWRLVGPVRAVVARARQWGGARAPPWGGAPRASRARARLGEARAALRVGALSGNKLTYSRNMLDQWGTYREDQPQMTVFV